MSCALQRRVVVGVEVIEAEDAVASFLQREGAVSSDEARGAGDQHRHAVGAAWGGGVADLFLPGGAAAEGGGEEVGAGVEAVVVVGGASVGGDEWRVVEGEEENEEESYEESGTEEKLGRCIEKLCAVHSSDVAVVPFQF